MKLDYWSLDDKFEPSPKTEERIQRDLRFLHYRLAEEDRGREMPLYLVDGTRYEHPGGFDEAKILGYLSQGDRIYFTDGFTAGYLNLTKPLEELTGKELKALSKERSNMAFKVSMLQRLQELVD